jgi:hypothetical protein
VVIFCWLGFWFCKVCCNQQLGVGVLLGPDCNRTRHWRCIVGYNGFTLNGILLRLCLSKYDLSYLRALLQVREWGNAEHVVASLSRGGAGQPPALVRLGEFAEVLTALEVGSETEAFYSLNLVLALPPSTKKVTYDACVGVKASRRN